MIANFLKYFYTNEFDDKVILKKCSQLYTVGEIKLSISKKIDFLKTITNKSIILLSDDNFEFFINFISCIFANKEIILLNNSQKIKDLTGFALTSQSGQNSSLSFDKIDIKNIIINIFTSGSSGENKCVQKTLENLINEATDLSNELLLDNIRTVVSTTTFNHLFGLTFYLMLPLHKGLCIDLVRVNYPEDIKGENLLFVTTPSFLEKMNKYSEQVHTKFKKIITAGARLKDEEFNYALSISESVTEIYGSTESGVIAHRELPTSNLKLFDNVEITTSDKTYIKTNYSLDKIQQSGDLIKQLDNREIELLGRTDRVLKIQEKRISADEIEQKLENHNFVKEAYCFDYNGKIASLIALSQDGFNFVLNKNILLLKKELKNYLKGFFDINIQRFKFIDELPKTEQGKIAKGTVLSIFNLNMSYPLILERNITEDFSNFKLYFYKHCNFFKGHFDNFPILPGVVQLLFASILIRDTFNSNCNIGQIKKIKFKNIIKPNQIIDLKITRNKSNFEFMYYNKEKVYSSGILPAENIFEEKK